MHDGKLVVLISLCLLMGLSVAPSYAGEHTARGPSYRYITIDVPTPNGQFGLTTLSDINEKGEIIGGFTNSNLGPYGFVLNNRMRPSPILCSKDVVSTEPQSINRRGEIAGLATVITDRIQIPMPPFEILITKNSGFFLDKRGKCTILDFPGGNLSEAIGVNDDGQVVGDYRDSGGKFHGFFWDAGLFLTVDVPFSDATSTAPAGINNVNQIVGFYLDNNRTASFPNGQTHGFIYDNGVFSSFDFPDGANTMASDINDRGQILGLYSDSNFVNHSFLLEDESFTAIDVPLSDVFETEVSGINNNGEIVGRYVQRNPNDPVNPFVSHGFLATPTRRSNLFAENKKDRASWFGSDRFASIQE